METPFTVYKLIILYMLSHSDTELTNSQLSEFILDLSLIHISCHGSNVRSQRNQN